MTTDLKEGGIYRIVRPIRLYEYPSHTSVGEKVIVKGKYNPPNSVLWIILTMDGCSVVLPKHVLLLGLEEI